MEGIHRDSIMGGEMMIVRSAIVWSHYLGSGKSNFASNYDSHPTSNRMGFVLYPDYGALIGVRTYFSAHHTLFINLTWALLFWL